MGPFLCRPSLVLLVGGGGEEMWFTVGVALLTITILQLLQGEELPSQSGFFEAVSIGPLTG